MESYHRQAHSEVCRALTVVMLAVLSMMLMVVSILFFLLLLLLAQICLFCFCRHGSKSQHRCLANQSKAR